LETPFETVAGVNDALAAFVEGRTCGVRG
jgi:hypothetical protein